MQSPIPGSQESLKTLEKEKLRSDNTIDQLLQNGAKVRERLARWNPLADEVKGPSAR